MIKIIEYAVKGENVLEKYIVQGGHGLAGEVNISGAKNAVVAILTATVLAEGPCLIDNIPNISDVKYMIMILEGIGATVEHVSPSALKIDTSTIKTHEVAEDLAHKMRASYYFLGALLARFNRAEVPLPGGCNFGVRPIDLHLRGFESLGASYVLENGNVILNADQLVGDHIYFDKVTVGATINVMLAAVKAKGQTIIENAAKEPHIVDLANFLNSMGANIMGAGTDVIKIRGVDQLHGTEYSIIPDQIEAGTYMAAAAATRGNVLVKNIIPKHMESISSKLRRMGLEITEYDDAIRVRYVGQLIATDVTTRPHPGFPTDMQPQIATVLCLADGTSIVKEGVWDNRFKYLDELRRMGARVSVSDRIAIIQGIDHFTGARVAAVDLRAGAAMVIAALAAHGTTEITNIRFIERGYEQIVAKLQALGANIERVATEEVLAAAE